MRSISTSLAVLALFAFAAPAAAQSDHRSAVVDLLRQASQEVAAQGFRTEPRIFDARSMIGMLPRGGAVVLEANLRAGVRYTVLGVCDSDCQDLDLRAHSPGGNQVLAEDVNTDDVPILTFVAPADGPHPITVVMSDCRTELCYFGVRVLAR
jgi:hypothetical protein